MIYWGEVFYACRWTIISLGLRANERERERERADCLSYCIILDCFWARLCVFVYLVNVHVNPWSWHFSGGFRGCSGDSLETPFPSAVLNNLWKRNNLVSVRPNYFLFIGYIRKNEIQSAKRPPPHTHTFIHKKTLSKKPWPARAFPGPFHLGLYSVSTEINTGGYGTPKGTSSFFYIPEKKL